MIYGNEAGDFGGGIFCVASSPSITNNTVFGNTSSSGGGFYCVSKSNPSIVNTILWNNTASQGKEISVEEAFWPSTLSISYSDVEGGIASTYVGSGSTLNWGIAMIDEDPLLADPGSDDLHLTWLSSCVNRGNDDNAPSHDFDGDPRPYMGTVDMGADEFTDTHPLEASSFTVSESSGGAVNFFLEGGVGNAGRDYLVLGGITGSAPGLLLPGGLVILPLNWDVFTDFMLPLINSSLFLKFLWPLDGIGQGTAHLNAPPLPSGFVGLKMYYAFCLNSPFDFKSNPVVIEIVP
jgi:hypothetical protein